MTAPFPQKIVDAMPSDNELVVGTVISGNPLSVSARGATITGAGRISTTGLTAGDSVMMLREGATWAALGKLITSADTGLGLTSINMSAASALLALTAAEQDVPGTSITFTTASPLAYVVAWWFADYEVLTAATATGTTMLRVDGVTNASPAAIIKQLANTERMVIGQSDLLRVTPGDHTAILRANRVGGADGQLRTNAGHTTLLLAVFE